MSPNEICTQLSLWIVNLYIKSYIFFLHFILYRYRIYMCGSGLIRIKKAPEYGSNTDPDPQHWEEPRPAWKGGHAADGNIRRDGHNTLASVLVNTVDVGVDA